MIRSAIALVMMLCTTMFVHAQEKSLDDIFRSPDDTTKVNALVDASYGVADKNLSLADSLVDVALGIATKIDYQYGIGRCYYNRAIYQQRRKNYQASLQWFDKAGNIYQRLGRTSKLYGVYQAKGNSYYHLGEFEKSDSLFSRVITYAEQVRDTALLTVTLHSFALSYRQRSMFAEALKMVLRSAAIRELQNDRKMLATDYNTIGNLLRKQKRYDEAIKYFKSGIKLAEETGSRRMLETLHTNLGTVYKDDGQYNNAMSAYRTALGLMKSGTSQGLSLAYQNMSTLFNSMGKNDSAFYYARKSLQLSFQENDNRQAAINYYNMAQWMLNANYVLRSQQLLDSANVLATNTNYKELLVSINKLQADILAKQNDHESAYTALQKSIELKDSVYGIETAKQLNELMTKYETERKENEIAKLNSEKLLDAEKIARQKTVTYALVAIAALILISGLLVFRNVQNKRTAEKHVAVLEKQNAIESMRSKIASDVHDDMGANLTRLGLNAQQLLTSAAVPAKEKELAEKIALQSKEVMTGMREIIWASDPANDNLKSMLGFMRQYIDRFFDGTDIRAVVSFPHNVGDVTLHPEVRRNLFLILKESLNNAVKYSDTDRIDIDFNNHDDKFNLNIKDYGKGIDDNNKVDFTSGLRNMEKRAEQIQSIFKLITAPGNGVQIIVEGKLY